MNTAITKKKITFRSKQEERILKELKITLCKLLGNSLVGLYLYGSIARGDFDENSDIDIAIIVRELTRERKNEILHKVADLELKFLQPLSTIVMSEDDLARLKEHERRFALDLEKEGIPL